MKGNIFVKNILSKFKSIFNKDNRSNYSEVQVVEKKKEEISAETVKKIESIKEEIKNDVVDYNKIYIKFTILDDYVKFIKEKCEEKINLSNIDVQVWYKFNKYDLSKFTKERIEEFEEILYEVIQHMQDYFNKKNISWFEEEINYKNKISNDISFIIRYSENLIRSKYQNKRMLSYEKFENIDSLKIYLDEKFENIINARTNGFISNIPDNLFDLDIEEVILNENTFNIEPMNKYTSVSKIEKVSIEKEKDIKIEEILVDSKELDSILNDIDDFEI